MFLAVPKTGTSAWQSALAAHADMVVSDPPELKHAPLYRYQRFFEPIFQKVCGANMDTLAVMREPVSWLGSWYRYRQRPFLDGQPNSTRDVSFDEFVQAYLKGKRPSFADVGSQARFLSPRADGPAVTTLIRYEDEEKLRVFLERRLRQEIRVGRENVSPDAPLELSDTTRAKLVRKHAEEFELYNSLA